MNTPDSNSQNNAPSHSNNTKVNSPDKDFEKLAQQIANRVWELWREELRYTRERRGSKSGR